MRGNMQQYVNRALDNKIAVTQNQQCPVRHTYTDHIVG